MLDPKLNELPAGDIDGTTKKYTGAKQRRQGLSINDTIAADANKSVGATGVGTSNITAGLQLDEDDPNARLSIEPVSFPFSQKEVAMRAFELWQERGCPTDSPEVDWKRAEQELRARSRGSKAYVAAV
jgi:isopentenyl diphosphate isomerase/L-lactate dehydrogenase-like FMN-dependent dehydrogenase